MVYQNPFQAKAHVILWNDNVNDITTVDFRHWERKKETISFYHLLKMSTKICQLRLNFISYPLHSTLVKLNRAVENNLFFLDRDKNGNLPLSILFLHLLYLFLSMCNAPFSFCLAITCAPHIITINPLMHIIMYNFFRVEIFPGMVFMWIINIIKMMIKSLNI